MHRYEIGVWRGARDCQNDRRRRRSCARGKRTGLMLRGCRFRLFRMATVMVRGRGAADHANRDFAGTDHDRKTPVLDHRHETDWYGGAIEQGRQKQERDLRAPLSMPLKPRPHVARLYAIVSERSRWHGACDSLTFVRERQTTLTGAHYGRE